MPSLVSVILPTNTVNNYLFESIQSILDQTYTYFELVIVINGENKNIIETTLTEKYSDSRIKLYKVNLNQLPFVLNYGVNVSNGEYIARMDSDDISSPERLEKQIAYLNSYPDIGFIGSDYELIDENGISYDYINANVGSDNIKKRLCFGSQFAHPTVMIRKTVFFETKGYAFGFFAEDYEYWIRMMYEYNIKSDNIKLPLLKYRVHSEQATNSKNNKRNIAYNISLAILCALKYKKPRFLFSILLQSKKIRNMLIFLKKKIKK
ncbi:glycosyltransferase [Proteus vulgaris]|uniref:glycosyltransferase n=1 Tax=Proteus mirabilis TaxID=584 RepID=UPI0013745475|nr:glycosyltransferase [Proteus mirabilis]MDC5973692.1 glycosyltransferase [Proteus mirabilis]QHP75097.1 glycosyltransferase [Proteus vulgaris]